uniref:Uncharacterized protein LOC101511230 n=1 Tax=Cicer arietinum TaxID=3827 RepID=A0A1S2Z847_CICAR|nr:uncharacterized protein LOC101511230 [Cicer arietinum]
MAYASLCGSCLSDMFISGSYSFRSIYYKYENKEVANNKDVARPTAREHVYHISGEEAPSSSEHIQGECLIVGKILFVIYDSGATNSFISLDWVDSLQLDVTTLPFDLLQLCHVRVRLTKCAISISRYFEVPFSQQTEVFFEGRSSKTCVSEPINMTQEVVVDEIPVVKDFSKVFPPDVLRLPPICDVEFSINVIPSTGPIFMSLHNVPLELSELKNQLEDFMSKKSIWPCVSSWGALVLLVKKKDEKTRLCVDY